MAYFNCLFYFTADKAELLEVKRRDLAESSPLSEIYNWLFIENGVVNKLTFQSMNKEGEFEFRDFSEGNLKFNDDIAVLNFKEREIVFERKKTDSIPTALMVRITNYFR